MRRLLSLFALGVVLWAVGTAEAQDVSPRIVGPNAKEATAADWPFVTLMYPGDAYLCGGSVINSRWVLSAGHCAYDGAGNPLTTFPLYPGAYDRDALPPGARADAIAVHPAYSPSGYAWDFLLLRLPSPTTVSPVALPAPDDDAAVLSLRTADPATGPRNGRIAGWGLTEDGGTPSTRLRDAGDGVPILTDGNCTAAWDGLFDPASMVCAGGYPAADPPDTLPTTPDASDDACNGDSGGPLAADIPGRRLLIGVTSFGSTCGAPGYPGVFAEVSAVRGWICDTVTSPTSITAGATSTTTTTVSWTPDTTTCPWNNPAVQVTASPGGATASAPLSSGRATLSGLGAGTTYTVSARVVSSSGATPPPATATVALPVPVPVPEAPRAAAATPPCSRTFFQQDARTSRTQRAPDGTNAVRVVSRLRIYEDAQSWCRADLTFIFRNRKTGARIAQLPGSTLGFRKLTGKDFSAPVVGWPTAREFRFEGSDSAGLNRRDARLVLVSYLGKTSSMPAPSNIELMVVRRVPRDPAQASSAANPLFAQKNAFGTAVGWATVS